MPELPEVEVVRRGLTTHLVGRTIERIEVLHPRAIRRHIAGPADLIGALTGVRIERIERRGKFMWLCAADRTGRADTAVVVHLGMSGQMLVKTRDAQLHKHTRIVVDLDDGNRLCFVDQRTFGGWMVEPFVVVDGELLPASVAHIARDALDPRFDIEAVITKLRHKHTKVKRALLDQTVLSGVGNIYADEALWRARIHGRRLTDRLTRTALRELIGHAQDVMRSALAVGGTSFDALYVNVNGESGYFDRSLAAYGQRDRPCHRCGAAIAREAFMNRSSFYCPVCQPAPRSPRRR